MHRYLPAAVEYETEYEVTYRGVNCNFSYLIDFDIHSEQKQTNDTKTQSPPPPIFCIFFIP